MSVWETVFGKKFSRKRDAWLALSLYVIAPVMMGTVLAFAHLALDNIWMVFA